MQNYLDFIGNELKALTSIPSPSGYTKDVGRIPDEDFIRYGI